MKKIIRQNVFETNSSSTHSVSLGGNNKDFVLDTIYPDDNGIIHIDGGEYGWDNFKLNNAEDKASYVLTYFKYIDSSFDNIKNIIIEHTGAKDLIFNDNDSYIDHQSHDILKEDKDFIIDLIFNKNSFIFGGNDNNTQSPMFYDVEEFKKDGSVLFPQYKYEIKIDSINDTIKWVNYPTNEQIVDSINYLIDEISFNKEGDLIRKTYLNQNNTFSFYSWYDLSIDLNKNRIYFINDNHDNMIKEEYIKVNKEIDKDYHTKRFNILSNLLMDNNKDFCLIKNYKIIKL